MNRTRWLAAAFLLALVLLAGGRYAISRTTTVLDELLSVDEAELVALLHKKTFDELIHDANVICEGEGSFGLIYHADVLYQKAVEVPVGRLVDEILDTHNTNDVRILLIQLCSLVHYGYSDEKLTALLEQDGVDYGIKRNILTRIVFASEDISLLEKIALGNDAALASDAIELLYMRDPVKAARIADGTIGGEE